MFFFQILLYEIVDSSDAIISELSEDSDQKLPELVDNMHGILFLLLVEKIPYYCNKVTITVTILYILCYACSEQSNFFQPAIGHLSFVYNILK